MANHSFLGRQTLGPKIVGDGLVQPILVGPGGAEAAVGAGVFRVEFESDNLATRRQRPREPDRAVAAQRADLENTARAHGACHQHQELALRRRLSVVAVTASMFVAAVAGFGLVNGENVFKVCDQPHPIAVQNLLRSCNKGNVEDALESLRELWGKGYSAVDIIGTMFRVVKTMDVLSEYMKLEFIKVIFIKSFFLKRREN